MALGTECHFAAFLAEKGSLDDLIEESGRFAGGLAARLRERVYQDVVPRLAEGIVAARGLDHASAEDLADTYRMTVTVLFRHTGGMAATVAGR